MDGLRYVLVPPRVDQSTGHFATMYNVYNDIKPRHDNFIPGMLSIWCSIWVIY